MAKTAIIMAERAEEYQSLIATTLSLNATANSLLWLGEEKEVPRTGVNETLILTPQTGIPETITATIANVVKDQGLTLVILPTTKLGREVAPRVAVSLHAGYVEGVIGAETSPAGTIFHRLSFGGTVVEKVRVRTEIAVITAIHTDLKTDMSALPTTNVKAIPTPTVDSKKVKHIEELPKKDDMRSADRIIAAGRGIKKQQDLSMIDNLAKALNAKFACSRPLVEDLKWCPKDNQVGLSGQTVTPKLYIAIGISGQIQHTVGMRNSKVIVAINSDKSAPIFQVADYGIVGDLYQLVPELAKQLGKT